jgi:hypothetical protein
MTPFRPPPALLMLPVVLAALATAGCVGALRRGFAPEQRVVDGEAARACAAQVANELGYVQTADRDQPSDSSGRSSFTVERRVGTPDAATIDQLEVTLLPPQGKDEQARLRVVPARYVEDSRQGMTPGRSVPRLRPPGPAEGASRLESEGPRRRRVSSSAVRHDALEVTTRCAR